jgi:beta-galactosidase/beta-glucuronidase
MGPGDLSRFPRPDRARRGFRLLDGDWALEYDGDDNGIILGWFQRPDFSRRVRVPFCLESEASGIADPNPPRVVWYAREFELDEGVKGEKKILHFGAVDYRATVWLNGERLGEHAGGYTPFSFEVGDKLGKQNLLVVRVQDARNPSQPRGKQTLLKSAFFIFYPGVTGIWQPVWLEGAGRVYLEDYRVIPDIRNAKVTLACGLAGDSEPVTVAAEIVSPSGRKLRREVSFANTSPGSQVSLEFDPDDVELWSPEDPRLYGLRIEINCAESRDEVEGYFGLRTIEASEGKVLLNGRPLYQKLLLCQGYYPDGYREDVELVKAMGFNGVRVHQKIEDPRLLYWCDVLGCLVWEEMPSAYRFTPEARNALESQWGEAMERDLNHPCIIAWVPFNESWGVGVFPIPVNLRRRTREYVKRVFSMTKEKDQERLVIDNSGYDHTSLTDVVDIHQYLEDVAKCRELYEELKGLDNVKFSLLRVIRGAMAGKFTQNPFTRGETYRGQPVLVSEYGGFGFYKTSEDKSLFDNFREYTELIQEQEHICGYCYTQFYDTYQEKNGLLDFERKAKVEVERVKAVNERR